MNTLEEFKKINEELGEKKVNALKDYVSEQPYLTSMKKVFYNKDEFEKFEVWYKNRKEPIVIKGIVLDFRMYGKINIKTQKDTLTYKIDKFLRISDGKFYFISDNTRYIIDNSEFLKDIK